MTAKWGQFSPLEVTCYTVIYTDTFIAIHKYNIKLKNDIFSILSFPLRNVFFHLAFSHVSQ